MLATMRVPLFAQTNFWEQTNGPPGGTILTLVRNVSGYLFAGTGAGVFRSTDNGNNWIQVSSWRSSVNALAINSTGHIFAGTDGEVFRSTDDGTGWTQVLNRSVWSLAIDSSEHIFAGTNGGGVFRSTDNGGTWIQTITGLSNLNVRVIAINRSAGAIFAGTSASGVFRSSDNGTTWSQAGLSSTDVLGLTINSSGHIFAGTWGSGVFRFTDNGTNWTQTLAGLTDLYVRTLAVNPVNAAIFVGTIGWYQGSLNSGVFRSTDNGANWTRVLTYPYTYSLSIDSSANMFAGTINGIFRSINNGDSWTEVSTGLTNNSIASLAINSSGDVFAGTALYFRGSLFRSTDDGETWTATNNGLPPYRQVLSLAINPSGHIFASTGDGEIYRSTNNGVSWVEVADSIGGALAINSDGHIFACYGGVFRSTNNGTTWTHVVDSSAVGVLTINPSGHIFAGGVDGVYRSTDNGESWAMSNNGLTLPYIISDLTNDLNGNIFAGTGYCDYGCTGKGVFRSTNNGDSWVSIGLDTLAIFAIAVNSSGHIFAGTRNMYDWPYATGSVYRSTNGGTSWQEINAGLANSSPIGTLAINSSGRIFAGTYGNSVFRSVGSTVSVKELTQDASSFVLDQNYPNPFNPSTTIRFGIPQRSLVTLKIFDLLGRELQTLVSEELNAGIFDVEWDAGRFASGVYLYKLQAGEFVQTRKLLLLR